MPQPARGCACVRLRRVSAPDVPGAIADAHSDLLTELVFAAHERGEANPFRERWLEPLRRGGVVLQVCAVYVNPELPGEQALREALRHVHAFRAAVAANADAVVAVESAADLDRIGPERLGLLLSIEGVAFLGEDPWLADVLFDLGVRMASLTHNERNAYAGGCGTGAGLTPAGERLVDRLLELGVILDLAHASDQTFSGVMERVAGGTVLVSHACCRAVHDFERNVSDEQLRALAGQGGLLGLMPHPYVVDRQRHDLDRFVDHVDHAVAVAGIEHVGLGGDFLRQIVRALGLAEIATPGDTDLEPDAALDGLEGPQDYPALIERLRARGYAGDELAALLGGNLLGLLRRGLPS